MKGNTMSIFRDFYPRILFRKVFDMKCLNFTLLINNLHIYRWESARIYTVRPKTMTSTTSYPSRTKYFLVETLPV